MLYIQTPYGTFYKISLLCSRRDSSLKHQKEEKKQYGSFIKLSHMTFELYCKASDVMICLRNRPKFKQLFSKKLLWLSQVIQEWMPVVYTYPLNPRQTVPVISVLHFALPKMVTKQTVFGPVVQHVLRRVMWDLKRKRMLTVTQLRVQLTPWSLNRPTEMV